jgi:hypothetical protein
LAVPSDRALATTTIVKRNVFMKAANTVIPRESHAKKIGFRPISAPIFVVIVEPVATESLEIRELELTDCHRDLAAYGSRLNPISEFKIHRFPGLRRLTGT